MTNERAGLFEGGDDFDVSGFTKKPSSRSEQTPTPAPGVEAIRAVSEASQFRSREPARPAAKREPMRHRTGRNLQFNVKLRAETVESFYDLAKRHDWTLGETVERALAALQTNLKDEL